MLRFLPILLLVLQTLPMAVPVASAQENAQTPQKMSCCGGCCKCAANGCQCGKKQDKAPAPSKTPFSVSSIDFAPPLAPARYALPSITATGEIKLDTTTLVIACSNNCRQALLGRWQN
jgi:hypothetical protein